MDRMDDFFSTARSALETAGHKTGEMVKLGRLRLRLMRLRDDIRRAYEQIGRQAYQDRALNSEKATPLFSKIDTLLLEVEDVKARMDELGNNRRCPRCDAANHKDASYCSRCGTELVPEKEEKEASDSQ